MRRGFSLVATAVLLAAAPLPAAAFRDGNTFEDPLLEGGGSCIYYNGSPRAGGYTCVTCHARTCNDSCHSLETAQGTLQLDQGPGDKLEEIFAGSEWQPGMAYTISVALKGNHIRPYQNHEGDLFSRDAFRAGTGINYAGFTAEFVDDTGAAVGTFEAGEGTIALDGGRVIAAVPITNRRNWTFTYHAPAAGTGRITVYLSAVASIGAPREHERSFVRAIDFRDDDTFVMDPLVLCEAGTPCDRTPPTLGGDAFDSPAHRYGCNAADPWQSAPVALMVLLLLAGFGARRRTR